MRLVTWPLSGNEALVDFVLPETNISAEHNFHTRKAARFVPKRTQLQPRFCPRLTAVVFKRMVWDKRESML